MQPHRPLGQTGLYVVSIAGTIATSFLVPRPLTIVATAFCLLAWTILCRLICSKRDTAAAFIAMSVFILTVLASWITGGTISHSAYRELRLANSGLVDVVFKIEKYREQHNDLPVALDDILDDDDHDIQIAKWPWGRKPVYRITDKSTGSFELLLLGRDGVPGGNGMDSDFTWRSDLPDSTNAFYSFMGDQQIPLWQYLFETRSTVALVFRC